MVKMWERRSLGRVFTRHPRAVYGAGGLPLELGNAGADSEPEFRFFSLGTGGNPGFPPVLRTGAICGELRTEAQPAK